MHSPIIYLIEQGTKFSKKVGHHLPSDYHKDEIELSESISEADYAKENIIKQLGKGGLDANECISSPLKSKNYFNVDSNMNLSISYQNIVTWDLTLRELFEYFSKRIKKRVIAKSLCNVDVEDTSKILDLEEKLGNEYGGIRFVVITRDANPKEDGVDCGIIMNTRDLIDYARYRINEENKEYTVNFKICTNVIADYHH